MIKITFYYRFYKNLKSKFFSTLILKKLLRHFSGTTTHPTKYLLKVERSKKRAYYVPHVEQVHQIVQSIL